MSICVVAMAGGSGTRLWPVSRAKRPKQFLNLYGDETMLQATFNRLSDLNVESSITICNNDHRFFVAEQLREINLETKIILEPTGKNTAPAIALSAFCSDDDPLLLVLSADHLIKDKENFTQAVNRAIPIAEDGKLVVFGVAPDNPNTGYGYIKKGINYKEGFEVQSFKEKPKLNKAKKYLSSKEYFWNSGMFLFKASVYLEELNKYEPDIYEICKSATKSPIDDLDFTRIDEKIFSKCPSKSIDYAVMEKTSAGVVVPFHGHWNDIGSWETLWESKVKDSNNNVCEGDVSLSSVENSYIHSSNRLISVNNVSDLIIIDTDDALLVSSKVNSQNIKNIVHKLKSGNRSEIDNHRKVFRPWGYFDSIDFGTNFQVKRILINPGAKISLQKHKFRSEHWIIVKGIATIACGNKVFKLEENQSTYIPKGEVHRLENMEKSELEIIEIQTGNYLGEDDIIRLKDDYHRT